jgi:chromate transporter
MIAQLAYLFVFSVFTSLITFGGGSQALYYQYAVLQQHWLTRGDLSAMLAWGYATPGPAVFMTSTFIGYRIAGVPGAIIGTIGIFIMPFLLALLAARYLSHLLKNPHAEYVIRGIGFAAAGVVAATAFSVLQYKTAASWQIAIALIALAVSIRWKLNPFFILLTGGLLGLLF